MPATHQTPSLPDGGHCPSCGLPLKRLHRHPLDRWISVFRSVHRYRCSDPACGWEGVVGREWAGPGMPAHPPWQTRLAWMLAGAALATAGMGVALLVHRAARPAVGPRTPTVAADAVQDLGTGPLAVAAGAYDDGRELLRADPRVGGNPTPLALRHGCVWGVPGRTPYRGSVEQALNATQLLPPEVVQRISQMVEYGWTKDRLEISRKAIRSIDGRHLFRPQIAAMGFGNAMCFDTIVNFPAGHVEYAALYEAEDRSGKTYSVMVPYVCNNVSVLGVRAEITPPGGQMPEPSSWWLVGTALAVLAVRPRRTSGGPA